MPQPPDSPLVKSEQRTLSNNKVETSNTCLFQSVSQKESNDHAPPCTCFPIVCPFLYSVIAAFFQASLSFNLQFHFKVFKYSWDRVGPNLSYAIKWKILCCAPHYSNITKRCNLCIADFSEFHILCKPGNTTLNKRNELISKCRHEDNFYWDM